MGQTSYRGHDFYLGLFMEQGKSNNNDKRKTQIGQTPMRSNSDVLFDGGLNRSSNEDSVMELEPRGWGYTDGTTIYNFCKRKEDCGSCIKRNTDYQTDGLGFVQESEEQ